MKIKEILATTANKMAHKAKDEMFIEIKERILSQIDRVSKTGRFNTYLTIGDYSDCSNWAVIECWLKELGYRFEYISTHKGMMVYWDDLPIAKINMVTEPKSAVSRIEFGWKYDPTQYDFICSGCGKHSEYTTDYCPHCGVKTYVPVGEKWRKY